MSVVYRFKQGIRALFAFSVAVDEDLASAYLNQEQMRIFQSMQHSEQLHSLNVLRSVLAQEKETPHDLAIAALLHDCGKSRYALSVVQKTLTVLVRRFMPGRFATWSQGSPENFFTRSFVVNQQHPVWGAELLADTDTPGRVLWLIAHHADDIEQWQGHPYEPLLRRLKRADDVN